MNIPEAQVQQQIQSQRLSVALGRLVATIGILAGSVLHFMGLPLEGGAVAVLGFAPLYLALDWRLTPTLPFGFLTLAYFYQGIGFGLGPLARKYGEAWYGVFIEEGFVAAQWATVLGLAIYAILFPWFFRRVQSHSYPPRDSQTNPQLLKHFTALITIVGVLNSFGSFGLGFGPRLGEGNNSSFRVGALFAMFDLSLFIGFFLLGICAVRFGRRWTIALVLTYLGMVAFYFLDGNRGQALSFYLAAALGAAIGGIPRRRLYLTSFALGVVLLPFAQILGIYRTDYVTASSFGERAVGLANSIARYKQSLGNGETGWATTFLWDSTAHTVDRIFYFTPGTIPYAGLEGTDRLLYLYLPRIILPGRTLDVSDGGDTACLYSAAVGIIDINDARCGSGDYTPAVGDGYRRFGWIGVPIIYASHAALLGAGISYIWSRKANIVWLAMLAVAVWVAWLSWSLGFLGLIYHASWFVPKYALYFVGLRAICRRLPVRNSLQRIEPSPLRVVR